MILWLWPLHIDKEALSFPYLDFIIVRQIPFIPRFWQSLLWNVLNFSCTFRDDQVDFVLHLVKGLSYSYIYICSTIPLFQK